MKVYLDNAATTKVDPEVLKAMEPYFSEEFGNPSSLHTWGQRARVAVDEARERVAKALNASKTQEIIFTSCATEANNWVLKGVTEYAKLHDTRFRDGKVPHLLVSPIEHHCVLDSAKYLEKTGRAEVTWLKVDEYGLVDPTEIRKKLRKETVLVSVMYVNNEVGTVEPLEEISAIIRDHREKTGNSIYFHTDGVQAIEYLNCDVQKLGVDLLSLSGHKFHAPKGVGALFIREGTRLTPLIHGGGQEYKLRAGTENVPYIVGLGKAIERISGMKGAGTTVEKLRDKLISGILERIPQAKLTGHPEKRVPHIASFVFPGVEGEAMLLLLDREGIAASSGSACTSGTLEPSHVLLAMGISKQEAHASLRLSLSRYTKEDEINYVIERLPLIINRLRMMAPGGKKL